jgi:kinesin family member 11
MSTVEAHLAELQQLQEKHSSQAAGINTHADEAFQNSYKVQWKSIETSLAPQVPH